jgi:hypothetical protein
LDDPWLDGKTHSLEVRNRPAAYILEVEEERNKLHNFTNTAVAEPRDSKRLIPKPTISHET